MSDEYENIEDMDTMAIRDQSYGLNDDKKTTYQRVAIVANTDPGSSSPDTNIKQVGGEDVPLSDTTPVVPTQLFNDSGRAIMQFTKTAVPDLTTVDYAPTTGDFSNGFGVYIGSDGNFKFKALNDIDWITITVPENTFLNIVVKAISKDSTAQVQMIGI